MTKFKTSNPVLLALILFSFLAFTACSPRHTNEKAKHAMKVAQLKSKVKHIVIIYEENWSFDGLFGDFPGANNLTQAHDTRQYSHDGKLYDTVPRPFSTTYGKYVTDVRFDNVTLPAAPYDLLKYIKTPSAETGDLRHLFYAEQLQIDSGRMDKFVAYTDNPGLTMSYINLHNGLHLLDTLEWKLASEYTLCDNFFHSAFGGSFLNHIWFVSSAMPDWDNAAASLICKPKNDTASLRDAKVTPDGYVVNTSISINHPHPAGIPDQFLVPYQYKPTIADRLMDAGISWAWYSGQWDNAVAKDGHDATFDSLFQYHHQPLLYFNRFSMDSVKNKKKYLLDEQRFFEALSSDTLRQVSFIKPFGADNEHPGYSDLWTGMEHAQKLVDSIMHSKYWKETVIIITSDENGGRWDHVAPPKIDRWGPGTRIPAIIISPFAKKHNIDHTQYETVSILKLIETRFDLKALTNRDFMANDLLNAFDF